MKNQSSKRESGMITISHVFISSVGKGVRAGVYHDCRISLAYNKTVNSFACIGKNVFLWIVLVYFLFIIKLLPKFTPFLIIVIIIIELRCLRFKNANIK